MSEQNPKPKTERIKLEDVVTPIFDAAMGQRLATARMQRFWDQVELGQRLGLNGVTVGRIEGGSLGVPRHPFSVSQLEAVFGPAATKYILMNTSQVAFDPVRIRNKFTSEKMRLRKKREPGEHWTQRALREGRPVRGASFMGIPTDVWNLANKIHKESKNNPPKPVKRRDKKSG